MHAMDGAAMVAAIAIVAFVAGGVCPGALFR